MNKPYLLFRNHNSPYWYAQIRLADGTFFTAKRYEKLRAKAIKDGSRRKYKKSDVLTFVECLQKLV